jgi:BirA family biotin operon repressor/biotin-[acetyl-CoA-carboxylase] ligase
MTALNEPPRGPDVSKLDVEAATKKLGHTILFSHEVHSTNQWAKHLAKLGAAEGTVTVADTQKRGRGRFGRKWVSPEGGLWFSVILKPKLSAQEATKLVFVAGFTVAEVLKEQYDLPVETKWPNDTLVHGRKICGVLCEASTSGGRVDSVVVGFGLNANIRIRDDLPVNLQDTSTSLQDELGKRVNVEKLFHCLIEKLGTLHSLFSSKGFLPILEGWKKYAVFIGQKIVVTDSDKKVAGLALDVDEEGMLLLKTEDGLVQRVSVGEVSFK